MKAKHPKLSSSRHAKSYRWWAEIVLAFKTSKRQNEGEKREEKGGKRKKRRKRSSKAAGGLARPPLPLLRQWALSQSATPGKRRKERKKEREREGKREGERKAGNAQLRPSMGGEENRKRGRERNERRGRPWGGL